MPIFLALFRLIDQAAKGNTRGVLTDDAGRLAAEARRSSARRSPTPSPTPTATSNVQILAAVLVVAMTATTFLTQRQLMTKNMPADALTGQYAQQQKMLLYVLPVVFAVGGIAFPIGVLIYWTTSNLWTMGQQFYVIRNNPAPGHPGGEGQGSRATPHKRARKGGGREPRPPRDRRQHAAAVVDPPPPRAAAAQEADPRAAQEAAARDRAGRRRRLTGRPTADPALRRPGRPSTP